MGKNSHISTASKRTNQAASHSSLLVLDHGPCSRLGDDADYELRTDGEVGRGRGLESPKRAILPKCCTIQTPPFQKIADLSEYNYDGRLVLLHGSVLMRLVSVQRLPNSLFLCPLPLIWTLLFACSLVRPLVGSSCLLPVHVLTLGCPRSRHGGKGNLQGRGRGEE